MSNTEVERIAIEYVMELERAAGREPVDVRHAGAPYDISSPPRKIEMKAFSGSARGAQVPLEQRQVDAARDDRENFYVYIVDNVARASLGEMAVRILSGDILHAMIDGARPHITYWPTYPTAVYDQAEQLTQSSPTVAGTA